MRREAKADERRRARFAVYFVPEDDTALACFGHGVLGRDALARAVPPLEGLAPAPPAWTETPARYGFHATLKAPFYLAPDATEGALGETCAALARAHPPCPLTGLAVARLARFAALVLPGPNAAVDTLAADCVIGLEPFRAPLDAATLARRRPETLEPAARERLERWGYPHVLEGFRFHMTLSGPLPEAEPAVERWIDSLARRFDERVGAGAALDRLVLCREAAPGAPFVRVAQFPLSSSAAGPPPVGLGEAS